jgi:hypothetical protein
MSDQSTVELPAMPASSQALIDKMPPETAAVARAAMAQHYKVDHVGQVTAPAAIVPAPAPVKPAANTTAEAVARWVHFQKHSTLPQAEIIKAALANGIDLTAIAADAATAPIIAQQKQEAALQAALQPPETSHGYKIDYGKFAAQADNIEVMHGKLTAGYLSAGLPANLAEPLTLAMLESENTFANNLEENASQEDIDRQTVAWKTRALEEGSKVRALSGDLADFTRLMDLGEQALPKALVKELHASRSLSTAAVAVQLAAFGRVIEARKK